MADEVARLVAVMEANLRGFTKGMEQAQKVADQRFGQIEKRMRQTENTFSGSFKNMGGNVDIVGSALRRLAPFLTAGAILGYARGVLATATELKNVSDQLGITTQELQGLNSAARDTGAGADKINAGLATLTQNLGDAAKGNGDLAKMMRELNIPMGSTIQVLRDVADATQKATTQNEKMSIATTAFGKAGRSLIPLLDGGAAGLDKMFESARKKGQIWDPETIASLERAGSAFESLKVTLAGKFANPFAAILENILGLPAGIRTLQNSLIAAKRLAESSSGTLVGKNAEARIIDLERQIAARTKRTSGIPFAAVPAPEARIAVPVSEADRKKAEDDAKRAAEDIRKLQLDAIKDINKMLQDKWAEQDKLAKEHGEIGSDLAKERVATLNKYLTEEFDARQEFMKRAIDQGDAQIANEEAYTASLGKSAGEVARLGYVTTALNEARRAGITLTKEEVAAINQEGEAIAKAAQNSEDANRTIQNNIALSDAWRSGLEDIGAAALDGSKSFKDAVRSMLKEIGVMIIRLGVLRPLIEAAFGAQGTLGGGGGFLGSIGKLLGFSEGGISSPKGEIPLPHFASGGVSRTASVFAESGPEAAVPLPDGRRIPVDIRLPRIADPKPSSSPLHFNIVNQNSFAGAIDAKSIKAYADQVGVASAQAAVSAIRKNFPGMVHKAQRDNL